LITKDTIGTALAIPGAIFALGFGLGTRHGVRQTEACRALGCREAIERIAGGEFAEADLPRECSIHDAVVELPSLDRAEVARSVGDRELSIRSARGTPAGDVLRVWHDDGAIVALEIEAPRLRTTVADVRASHGAPEAKLRPASGDTQHVHWVYAERGFAVITRADVVVRVLVFPPTDLLHYRGRLARSQ
jgi:hypothetical protein